MSNSNQVSQVAMSDLATIRKAINLSSQSSQTQAGKKLTLAIQMIILMSCFAFIAVEIFGQNQMTMFLRATSHEQDLLIFSLCYIAGFLLLLFGTAMLVTFRSAQKNEEGFQEHIERHFRNHQYLGLTSDIFVKFVVLAILLVSHQSQFIAPLLLVFAGDFLIQNRIFQLPRNVSIFFGMFAIAVSAVQFSMHSDLLLIPLALFSLVVSISLVLNLKSYRANK